MSSIRYFDIGANLLASQYSGVYFDKTVHRPDLHSHVLPRSLLNYEGEAANVSPVVGMVLTSGTLEETLNTLALCSDVNGKLPAERDAMNGVWTTVGQHPTRASEIEDREAFCQEFSRLAREYSGTSILAYGELGLDYDRLQFSPKEVQHEILNLQLDLIETLPPLPLFLHNRNCGMDLYNALAARPELLVRSPICVHSFDGSPELMKAYLDLSSNTFIGFNGCSLRTEENLETAAMCPLDRMLLETDCPYCDIRPTHPSYKFVTTKFETVKDKKYDPATETTKLVKGRNEPAAIVQVAEVMAGVTDTPIEVLAAAVIDNTRRFYFS